MQLVEPLLAESQSALGAVDLEVVLHLAPGGDPVALDRARGAAGETQERAADVVDLDAPLAALAVGTLGDHRDAIAHDAGDRPGRRTQQKLGGGERVAADVGERAAAGGIVAEGERPGGVGHVVLGMNAAIAADLAEFARGDHFARKTEQRDCRDS